MLNLISNRRFKKFKQINYDLIGDKSAKTSKIEENKQFLCLPMLFQKFFQYLDNKIPVFLPSHWLKLIWDVFVIINDIILTFCLPVYIATFMHFDQILSFEVYIINLFIPILDVFLTFNTGFYYKGQCSVDRKMIFKNYFQNKLYKDILTYGILIANSLNRLSVYNRISVEERQSQDFQLNMSYYSSFQLFIHFGGILYLNRIRTLTWQVRKLEDMLNMNSKINNIINLVKLLGLILFISHIFACCWMFGAAIKQQKDQTWMNFYDIYTKNWVSQYLYAYYVVAVIMCTVGFGDISPQNETEVLICIVTMLVACGVFAYSVNAIGTISEDMNYIERINKKKLYTFSQYMKNKKISFDLQYKIREYLEYYWNEQEQQNSELEAETISILSDQLRGQLQMQAHKIVLQDNNIFKANFSQKFIKQCINIIHPIRFQPKQIIDSQYDDQCIYFIEKGSVEYTRTAYQKQQTNENITMVTLKAGDFFNYKSFFSGQNDSNTNYEIKTCEFTKILMIRRSEFIDQLQDFPVDFEKFCFLRDSLVFDKNQGRLGKKCQSCKSWKHDFQECDVINFIFDSYKIVQQNNLKYKEQVQRDIDFVRKNSQKQFNSWNIFIQVVHEGLEFYNNNIDYIMDQSWVLSDVSIGYSSSFDSDGYNDEEDDIREDFESQNNTIQEEEEDSYEFQNEKNEKSFTNNKDISQLIDSFGSKISDQNKINKNLQKENKQSKIAQELIDSDSKNKKRRKTKQKTYNNRLSNSFIKNNINNNNINNVNNNANIKNGVKNNKNSIMGSSSAAFAQRNNQLNQNYNHKVSISKSNKDLIQRNSKSISRTSNINTINELPSRGNSIQDKKVSIKVGGKPDNSIKFESSSESDSSSYFSSSSVSVDEQQSIDFQQSDQFKKKQQLQQDSQSQFQSQKQLQSQSSSSSLSVISQTSKQQKNQEEKEKEQRKTSIQMQLDSQNINNSDINSPQIYSNSIDKVHIKSENINGEKVDYCPVSLEKLKSQQQSKSQQQQSNNKYISQQNVKSLQNVNSPVKKYKQPLQFQNISKNFKGQQNIRSSGNLTFDSQKNLQHTKQILKQNQNSQLKQIILDAIKESQLNKNIMNNNNSSRQNISKFQSHNKRRSNTIIQRGSKAFNNFQGNTDSQDDSINNSSGGLSGKNKLRSIIKQNIIQQNDEVQNPTMNRSVNLLENSKFFSKNLGNPNNMGNAKKMDLSKSNFKKISDLQFSRQSKKGNMFESLIQLGNQQQNSTQDDLVNKILVALQQSQILNNNLLNNNNIENNNNNYANQDYDFNEEDCQIYKIMNFDKSQIYQLYYYQQNYENILGKIEQIQEKKKREKRRKYKKTNTKIRSKKSYIYNANENQNVNIINANGNNIQNKSNFQSKSIANFNQYANRKGSIYYQDSNSNNQSNNNFTNKNNKNSINVINDQNSNFNSQNIKDNSNQDNIMNQNTKSKIKSIKNSIFKDLNKQQIQRSESIYIGSKGNIQAQTESQNLLFSQILSQNTQEDTERPLKKTIQKSDEDKNDLEEDNYKHVFSNIQSPDPKELLDKYQKNNQNENLFKSQDGINDLVQDELIFNSQQ